MNMQGMRSLLPILVFTALYAVLSLSVTNSYYQLVLTLVPVWAIFGLSWNLLSGYTGLISFGHAAFFGVGAYAVALGQIHYDLSPWITIPIAAVLGGIAGLLIGFPTFRLQGHYFALAMLAYPLALLYLFEWLGLQEVTLPIKRDNPIAYMQFADPRFYTLVALAMMLATILLTRAIERSRFGMALLAIKQNEAAAEADGINTLTVAMFGGVGTVWGPVIGSVILIPLAETLNAEAGSRFPGIQGVIYGLAIICVILLAPEGLFWKVRDFLRKRSAPPVAAATSVADPQLADVVPLIPPRTRPVRSESNEDVVLEVKNLSRSFGGLKAVQDVSFKLRRNEILGIIGPNGAGKTTLFNLMNGFLRPGTGEILLDGRNMSGRKPHELCEAGIGRTFQIMRPFQRMSISDNVVVGAYIRARTDDEARQFAADAIARVGLSDIADRIASELTTKELRLMELARALAGQPRILLLDETLAGLGHDEANEVVAVIQRLARDGMTIAIIEHTMQAMVRLVDSFLVLDHGAVIVEGEPEAVTRDARVIEAYLGKKWMAHAPH
jgi:ABC-type branched-subunit amino acid transport system ATPase component/ABC-type branched-subunit amino acid transport system permease subunit